MTNIPIPQQIYRHFKGNLYQIVTLAEHTESGEALVVYQAMYGDFRIYARPLAMFMEKVDKNKYPDVSQEYRFELVSCKEDNRTGAVNTEAQIGQDDVTVTETGVENAPEEEEQPGIDPLVLEFLDADSYEERLNILAALHHRITDDMINTMAIAIDVEVEEGDIEERYEALKKCLLLYDKFECNRLR